ncbi:MAG: hypothetical protein ACPGVU_12125 [Limisphaerales bacterium]
MSEYIDTSADHDPEEVARIPGKRLYSLAQRVLFSCFFLIFLLVAHQHFFAGHNRSVFKQYLLLAILPVLLAGGVAGFIGWWQMRQAGAFAIDKKDEKDSEPERKRRRSKREAEGPEQLPWQRRDRK